MEYGTGLIDIPRRVLAVTWPSDDHRRCVDRKYETEGGVVALKKAMNVMSKSDIQAVMMNEYLEDTP